MSALLLRLRKFYGSHPLHLLTMVAGFALAGYTVVTFKLAALWNPGAWWQSIAVWLAAAVLLHDLVLFPLYALADRLLGSAARRSRRQGRLPVSARNHVRIPALASGLTFLIFWPGIVRQGAGTYSAATGQSQQPFLGRWLLLIAFMFGASALAYLVRLVLSHGGFSHPHDAAAPVDRDQDKYVARGRSV
ncbi:hypothetical protein [Mycobacterium sp. Marseille-P9652]|uniref:hypothetical protein n=1 Tax=Mycobacterium sp. Marseille-P9652 TaxID=2654950 RepID=UPI001E427E59|nr:hypothetical protein [Mycobacterium sp. Marseille-P9652]